MSATSFRSSPTERSRQLDDHAWPASTGVAVSQLFTRTAARPATFQCVSAGSRAPRRTGRPPPGSSDLSRQGEHGWVVPPVDCQIPLLDRDIRLPDRPHPGRPGPQAPPPRSRQPDPCKVNAVLRKYTETCVGPGEPDRRLTSVEPLPVTAAESKGPGRNITRCPGVRRDQASSSPPSTVSTWPVSQAVCASASRRIHSATSSGSPRRPNGMRAASASLR